MNEVFEANAAENLCDAWSMPVDVAGREAFALARLGGRREKSRSDEGSKELATTFELKCPSKHPLSSHVVSKPTKVLEWKPANKNV